MTPEILADVLTALESYKQRFHRPVFQKLPADVPVEKLDAVIEFAKVHHIEAKAMRNAGAHLVQVYSAFIYEGPGVVKRIAEKI